MPKDEPEKGDKGMRSEGIVHNYRRMTAQSLILGIPAIINNVYLD